MTKTRITFLALSATLLLLLLTGALFGQSSQRTNIYRYLSVFSEVLDLVRSSYVDQVSSDQLMEGAFAGVTDAIDEFSYYVAPAQMGTYKSFVDDDDNGVGLVVTKRFGYAYVISVIAGSPAAKGGIDRGDFIEKIGGTPTQKMAVWQVRQAVRANGPVRLQILRGGQSRREEIILRRADFHPVPLETRQYGGVAYVRIPYFEKGSAAEFQAALADVRRRGGRKLIVDLRGNAGGDVEEAIAAADELLTGGLITAREGRKVESKRWQADRETAYDGEVQVLTDSSTAAGGEIFAAAIRDNQRGKLVGVPTYGKSIMQRFIPLPSGGGVHMTVAHFTTPELKPIKKGIRPDVMVDLSTQALRDEGDSKRPKEDLILKRALTLFGEDPAALELKKAA
ncbi:MAG TPA: S41 family peptidase, partial [Thermoanaerobaculia bacterium]|nr:S41 family peptidase [Thermoanaerobaculia bacterium]